MAADEPTSIALPVGDGRVIVRTGVDGDVGRVHDGALRLEPGRIARARCWPGRDFAGPVTVHDVALVDGRPAAAVQRGDDRRRDVRAAPTTCTCPTSTGDMTIARVGETIGRQFGRMHLAGTGLIVGESSATRRRTVRSSPRSPARRRRRSSARWGRPPWASTSAYDDCDDCPRALTVDPVGLSFAWLDGDELVQREIGPNLDPSGVGPERRTALGDLVDTTGVDDLDLFPEGVLVSYSPVNGAVRPAVLVSLADGEVTTLGGTLATQGPGLDDGTRPAPPATTTTTTTTDAEQPTAPADPFPISGALVTAGADGVHRYTDGAVDQLTAEPMDLALDAGDGRVITQRHSGLPRTARGRTPTRRRSSSARTARWNRCSARVDWDGAVVLHDVDVVDGRRLLLFSLQRPLVPQESNEDLYVVDLDTGRAHARRRRHRRLGVRHEPPGARRPPA